MWSSNNSSFFHRLFLYRRRDGEVFFFFSFYVGISLWVPLSKWTSEWGYVPHRFVVKPLALEVMVVCRFLVICKLLLEIVPSFVGFVCCFRLESLLDTFFSCKNLWSNYDSVYTFLVLCSSHTILFPCKLFV